ncbi:DUF2891 domain-containing protein [Mesonia sp. K7]|uniref:DUF2891 domain-containing protein n=1 Tax=Mesonia sp. K7 TaxID=2218606 RepID=UPI000DA93CDE|nr:DUF2891 domain-containing protein [Mesonia sp. K7]PZD76915.1 DUF2891 domain-containing protein [Mesonia sp. K7]
MKKEIIAICIVALVACKNKKAQEESLSKENDTTVVEEMANEMADVEAVVLSLEEASRLAKTPFSCIEKEYPNKLGQVLNSEDDLKTPKELHPVFYGCYDWHSSVHGYWSLVSLLKQFPNMENAQAIKEKLIEKFTKENIQKEVAYFDMENNGNFERTYGWAWYLKLVTEIHHWDDAAAKTLEANLQPLTDRIVENYHQFLPKLNYPIRVGEHENTAFGLTFAYDYALALENEKLKNLISTRAKNYYLADDNCPIGWEPNGFDFLSPCLAEIGLMHRILEEHTFLLWMKDFMPQILETDFTLEAKEVTDRTDAKLVHIDGLNFSRAATLFELANKYKKLEHLRKLGDQHVAYSFKNLKNDSYEGGHWLTTFAIYALNERAKHILKE